MALRGVKISNMAVLLGFIVVADIKESALPPSRATMVNGTVGIQVVRVRIFFIIIIFKLGEG